MTGEHLRRKEMGRIVELSRYTPTLSYQLLTNQGKSELGTRLPEDILVQYYKQQIHDRDTYWKNKNVGNFGLELLEWIGAMKGKDGVAQWVERQKNEPGAREILEAVGLIGTTENLQKDFQQEHAKNLLEKFDEELQKVEEKANAIEVDNFEDQFLDHFARPLLFYANYLQPQAGQHEQARKLIETMIDAASKQSGGNIEKTIANLQKVAPLFAIAGEEGQYALAALTVAQAHATYDQEGLKNITQDSSLEPEEQRIFKFLVSENTKNEVGEVGKGTTTPETEELEAGVDVDVQKLLSEIVPDATSTHPYFVDKPIPADFAKNLTPGQVKNLEEPKNVWIINEKGEVLMSPDLFSPAKVLDTNPRYENAKAKTDNNIFALAATSAETPEKQAELYKTLSETILRVHRENPTLIENFLKAQTPDSLKVLISSEEQRVNILDAKNRNNTVSDITKEYMETFHEGNPKMPEEQDKIRQDFTDQKVIEKAEELKAFLPNLLSNFSQYPNRFLALKRIEVPQNAVEQYVYEVDMPKTVSGWIDRISTLSKVLEQHPVTVTPEQMGQIEFLARSVNTTRIIEWLQNPQAMSTHETPPFSETVTPAPVPMESTMPIPSEPQEVGEQIETSSQNEDMTMDEFFAGLVQVPEGVVPRRNDIQIEDITKLREFPTAGKDISDYEILEKGEGRNRKFDVLRVSKGTSGESIVDYNHNENLFISYLLKRDTIASRYAYADNGTILLGYIMEAASTPQEQEILFRSIFGQIANMYRNNSNLRIKVQRYFKSIDKNWKFPHLFKSADAMHKRLSQLTTKLERHEPLTKQDFLDINTYSLPFNPQSMVRGMQSYYREDIARRSLQI